jgi:hypothetical protein
LKVKLPFKTLRNPHLLRCWKLCLLELAFSVFLGLGEGSFLLQRPEVREYRFIIAHVSASAGWTKAGTQKSDPKKLTSGYVNSAACEVSEKGVTGRTWTQVLRNKTLSL